MTVILRALVLLIAGLLPTMAQETGFAKITVPYLTEKPLDGGVWYPAHGRGRMPLIVLSHGGGGSFDGHEDTARALARAGFVVAAVSHRGDTYDDQSQVLKLWRRPQQLRVLVSYMLETSPWAHQLNGKVGAFGFSNGGFTVLVAAGGVPDLTRIVSYCAANPSHDLCQALKQAGVAPKDALPATPPDWTADSRIKAIVAAAPAFGFAFDKTGLARVQVPVQLWGGAQDHHQPRPWFEDAVAAALPKPPEFHRIDKAGHYDFLPPCNATLTAANPQICADPNGFDRAGFHAQFNSEVVKFFRRTLAP